MVLNSKFPWRNGFYNQFEAPKIYFLRAIPTLKHYSDRDFCHTDIPSQSIYSTFFLTFSLKCFSVILWQSIWHSIWHLFWHIFWHVFWQPSLASILTFYLASFQAFSLAFFLASNLAFSVTFFLAFNHTWHSIWRSRSGSAHWSLALTQAEARQCPVRSEAHGWGLAVCSEIWSWLQVR